MKFIRLIVKEGTKFILALTLVLISMELYFRITTDKGTLGMDYTHPERNFALRPYFEGVEMGKEFYINSYGLRDIEREINKEPEAIRIAVFGDSLTFGSGVGLEDTFPKLLEKRLNSYYQKEIQVFNFGVGGYNTSMEFIYLKEKFELFLPDIVFFIFYTGNDTYTSTSSGFFLNNNYKINRMIKDGLRQLHIYGYLGATIINIFRNIKAKQTADQDQPQNFLEYEVSESLDPVLKFYEDNYQGWIEAKNTFKDISTFSKERNIETIFAITSHVNNEGELFDFKGKNLNSDLILKITEEMNSQGLSRIVLLDEAFTNFAEKEEEVIPESLSYHFSELGGELISIKLFDYLVKENLIKE